MKTKRNKLYQYMLAALLLSMWACKTPEIVQRELDVKIPDNFNTATDTANVAKINWRDYFKDENLINLIDEALENNQELNMVMQEIEMAKNEIDARKGEYLPFVGVKAGAGAEKVGRYTSQGANDATTPFKGTKENPEFLPDFMMGLHASWELDIWNKLHNAKKAAISNYLATVEGKNFMVTNLIAEIANSYYELLALDNQLEILKENIKIQSNALEIVKFQKQAARVTQLAVQRFQAQLLKTQSEQYQIEQQIKETENRIYFLIGGFPSKIKRDPSVLMGTEPNVIQAGIPAQLLANRPDVKQAEFVLAASKLNVKVAKARFYPSLGLSANVGYQAFKAKYLLNSPESLLYSIAGDLVAPLINKRAIKADYKNANRKQIQAVYNYEQTVLNAYVQVVNKLSKIDNMKKSFDLKKHEVETLTSSVAISNKLFKSARADYMEVLLTQREALEAKFELIETKKSQLNAFVNIYKELGGGWN
ncbi:TolC family protein [Ochrovirga pacifica]|uniref:TolC family protein n=1 Tax=Ochrovirga pacifica TaxID=1042376 RepID=UPI0002558AA9|nr:efflux transporter outer membrane subunit [Ochrovirga pacifica]